MKIFIFIVMGLFAWEGLFSQTTEKKSGVIKFNISKTGAEQKKFSDQSRIISDDTPPVITLDAPILSEDSLVKSDTRTLIVKGQAQDEGGLFAVMVNGIDANIAADGKFLAEVPLAIGNNTVRVVATDVAFNNSIFQFYSERTARTFTLPEEEKPLPPTPVNTYNINITRPSSSEFVTASDKFILQACITATAPIKKLMIYRDGSFVSGYRGNQIVRTGDCAFQVEEPVALKLGYNDIKIEVFAEDDTVSKNVTIEYSFYAANNYAVLIGNEKYNDPEIVDLSEPIKDAEELYNTLTKDYNFNTENVILLKNPTKSDIIGTLHHLRSTIQPDDNLLIFYAGHGYWDEGMGVGYWLPKDANKNNPVNWIPNTDLTNYLGAIKTKHTLLIADACFSGGIYKTRSAFSATYAIEMLYQQNSRKAITSGYLTEVPDRSVFFQYLIKNLRENSNEYISAEELFSKMRLAVINNSSNIPQYGTIQNVGDEGGDFIFIHRKK